MKFYIIPTLNRVRLLRKTLDSLLILILGISFELLIVDNGSTDGSVEDVNSLINENALKNLRCLREPLGLLSCRHRTIKRHMVTFCHTWMMM